MSNKTFDFDCAHQLPAWHKAPRYATPVTVDFDGAEGGAVWINDPANDETIAIRGPAAMRELARMLNAFADGYTPKMSERFQALDASDFLQDRFFVQDELRGGVFYSGASSVIAAHVASRLNEAIPQWSARTSGLVCTVAARSGLIGSTISFSMRGIRAPEYDALGDAILRAEHELYSAIAYVAARQ